MIEIAAERISYHEPATLEFTALREVACTEGSKEPAQGAMPDDRFGTLAAAIAVQTSKQT